MECLIRTPRYEALRREKTVFIVLPTDESESDADAGRAPTQRTRTRDAQGLVNYYEPADEVTDRMWREKLGRFIYDHVVKPDMARQGTRRACCSFVLLYVVITAFFYALQPDRTPTKSTSPISRRTTRSGCRRRATHTTPARIITFMVSHFPAP